MQFYHLNIFIERSFAENCNKINFQLVDVTDRIDNFWFLLLLKIQELLPIDFAGADGEYPFPLAWKSLFGVEGPVGESVAYMIDMDEDCKSVLSSGLGRTFI